MAFRLLLGMALYGILVARATETGVHMLNDGALSASEPSPSWIASGTIEMEMSGGTLASAGWWVL